MKGGRAIGNFFWLLGPLAVLLSLVVGYGTVDTVSARPGSWVDLLFWAMVTLGTLPAVVLLTWLQIQWLRRFHDGRAGRNSRPKLRSVARV